MLASQIMNGGKSIVELLQSLWIGIDIIQMLAEGIDRFSDLDFCFLQQCINRRQAVIKAGKIFKPMTSSTNKALS